MCNLIQSGAKFKSSLSVTNDLPEVYGTATRVGKIMHVCFKKKLQEYVIMFQQLFRSALFVCLACPLATYDESNMSVK